MVYPMLLYTYYLLTNLKTPIAIKIPSTIANMSLRPDIKTEAINTVGISKIRATSRDRYNEKAKITTKNIIIRPIHIGLPTICIR